MKTSQGNGCGSKSVSSDFNYTKIFIKKLTKKGLGDKGGRINGNLYI